ncbi:hypothetical protein P3T27_003145 [Kitasatospora sp. MAA19]|uniref:hypothetical protein n=1 Tax=Kitasatospora sp. MAA19 TaxID=3035090 RepID=UPI002474EE15|nr:hypothetical protein [Kitasatospora sp. MAA19]MDH6706422.1 hypothetical protein [Kitasatospora sp. MAA19]
MGEERLDGAGDEVDRGLVPGAEQQEELVAGLLLGASRLPSGADGCHVAGEVGPGVASFELQQFGQHHVDLRPRDRHLLGRRRRRQQGVHRPADLRPHVGGYAEEVADHRHGEREREGPADVHGLAGGEFTERADQGGGRRLDPGPQRGHPAG